MMSGGSCGGVVVSFIARKGVLCFVDEIRHCDTVTIGFKDWDSVD
jgi:hypothetical protein